MHAQTFKTEVLLLTSKQFSNSIDELKDKLDFKIILSDDFLTDLKKDKFGVILIDDEILNHKGLLPKLNNLKNTAKIGIFDKNNFKETNTLHLNSNKAKKKIKWESKWSHENAIKETAEWYNAYFKKKDMYYFTLNQILKYFKNSI